MKCPICEVTITGIPGLAFHIDSMHSPMPLSDAAWVSYHRCPCGLEVDGSDELVKHFESLGGQLAEHLNHHAVRQALAKL